HRRRRRIPFLDLPATHRRGLSSASDNVLHLRASVLLHPSQAHFYGSRVAAFSLAHSVSLDESSGPTCGEPGFAPEVIRESSSGDWSGPAAPCEWRVTFRSDGCAGSQRSRLYGPSSLWAYRDVGCCDGDAAER